MIRTAVLLVAILIGLAVIVLVEPYALALGMGIIFMGTLFYTVTNHDEIDRGRWFFVSLFVLLTGILALVSYQLIPFQGVTTWIARILSLVAAAIVSFILAVIFLLLSVYTASIQILASTNDEELSVWDAFRSLLTVMLGVNREWLVISDGERFKTNAEGLLKKMGGPGKVIIDPGNAVIFQRGGKITRVAGAGVVLIRKAEQIREIFDLRNQFTVQTVENVITADQIPLNVEMGISYRIKPADNPDSATVLKDNKNGFLVEEDTLLKATFNNTAGKWFALGAGAPTVLLRDQIMVRKLEQLFGHNGDPNTREVKIIEDAIKEACNAFGGEKGITVVGVDIRKIILPDWVTSALEKERIEEVKNQAAQGLLQGVLDVIRQRTGKTEQAELEMAQAFVEAVKLVETQGTKVIRLGSAHTPFEAPISTEDSNN